MTTSRFPGIMLALAAAVAVIACGKEEPPPPPPAPVAPPPKPEITVNLGHAAPLSGPLAHLGKDNENGALLAIDDLNAQKLEIGGALVTFKLQSEDDQGDATQAAAVAQKLVDAKVNGVIGHLNSGATLAAAKIYFDAGIPQVTGASSNPAFTQQGFNTAFRVFANDVQQAKALAEFVAKEGIKKVAIVDDHSTYGQGLAEEFKKALDEAGGIKVVASESLADGASDFKALLNKLKGKKPDLVFFAGMDAQAGPFAKQMKERGLKSRFLTGDGGCTPEFINLAGEAAEGQYCSLPGQPLDKMPKGPDFKAKYSAKYNQDIQLYAPYVYDAVMVVADAMKRANSVEPGKYLAELPKTHYQGVTARIAFDEKGDLKDGAISLYQVKEGKWEYLETFGAAEPEAEAPPPVPAAPAAQAPAGGATPAGVAPAPAAAPTAPAPAPAPAAAPAPAR